MPTKINHGGKPQPYIDKGNGEAGGQWADYKEQSNKFFKSFHKPDEKPKTSDKTIQIETKPIQPKVENKQELRDKYHLFETIENLGNVRDEKPVKNYLYQWANLSGFGGYSKEQIDAVVDKYFNEYQNLTDKFFYKDKYGYLKTSKFKDIFGNDKYFTKDELKTNQSKAFDNFVNSYQSTNVLSKENLIDNYNSVDSYAKNGINFLINTGKMQINSLDSSNETPYSSGCDIDIYLKDYDENGYSSELKGETLSHEVAHKLDNQLLTILATSDEINNAKYKNQLSNVKKLSNGLTLGETIAKEMRKMKENGTWESIKNEYDALTSRVKIRDAMIKKFGEDYEKTDFEYWQIYNKATKQVTDEIGDEIFNTPYEKYDARRNDIMKQLDTNNVIEKYNNYEPYKKQIKYKYNGDYMCLSDMYGFANREGYGFCGGHKSAYYNHASQRALEFYAECRASRTIKGREDSIKLVKKNMPESYKAFLELDDMINNYIEKGEYYDKL